MVEALKKKAWRELTTLTERDRALLTVAEKLSATRMTAEDWAPLRQLDEQTAEASRTGEALKRR